MACSPFTCCNLDLLLCDFDVIEELSLFSLFSLFSDLTEFALLLLALLLFSDLTELALLLFWLELLLLAFAAPIVADVTVVVDGTFAVVAPVVVDVAAVVG